MSLIKINPKHEQQVLEFINEMISFLDPDKEGLHLEGQYWFHFSDRLYILGELIEIDGYKKNTNKKRMLIRDGIIRYKNYKVKNIAYIKRALNNTLKDYLKKPYKKFTVIIPLNIKYSWLKSKRKLKINEYDVFIKNFTYVNKNYLDNYSKKIEQLEPLLKMAESDTLKEIKKYMHPEFTFFIISIYERDYESAFRKVDRELELLRSIFVFGTQYRSTRFSFGPYNPISRVGPSKYMLVFDSNNNHLENYTRWVHDEHLKPYSPMLDDEKEKLEFTLFTLNLINKMEKNQIKTMIDDILHLYSDALDENRPHYAFLHLWQILEIIFRYTPDDKFKTVIERIKKPFIDSKIIPKTIDIIAGKRNNFVHYGYYSEIQEKDVARIKNLVDSILYYLIYNKTHFNTKKSLIYYFDNIKKDLKQLENEINLLKKIQKIKKSPA